MVKMGLRCWKNGGVTCIGKVPPDAATCITNSITPIAFPTFPNIETNQYTIAVNTILVNIDNNTNDKRIN